MPRMEFRRWLNEAKRPDPVPDMVGFVLRYNPQSYEGDSGPGTHPSDQPPEGCTLTASGGYQSQPYPTLADAYAAKRETWNRQRWIGNIYTLFRDGTSRPLGSIFGGVAWHINRAGRMVNDATVSSTKRGRTNHAYIARNHPTHQFFDVLGTLVHDLTPNNMPMQTGHETPPGWWEMLRSALDLCLREHQITPMAMFYDRAFEEYDEFITQPAVKCCLSIIHRALEILGQAPDRDARLEYE